MASEAEKVYPQQESLPPSNDRRDQIMADIYKGVILSNGRVYLGKEKVYAGFGEPLKFSSLWIVPHSSIHSECDKNMYIPAESEDGEIFTSIGAVCVCGSKLHEKISISRSELEAKIADDNHKERIMEGLHFIIKSDSTPDNIDTSKQI